MVFDPLLVPTKEGMLPDPVDGNPMAELEFVQLNELLFTVLVKLTVEAFVLAHII